MATEAGVKLNPANAERDVPLARAQVCLPGCGLTVSPKIRQIYWCKFWADSISPEMPKDRPVLVVSFKNTLIGPCTVLPISTDPQEGLSAQWGHKLAKGPHSDRDSWVVCNHIYTVSTGRLRPDSNLLRVPEDEFNMIWAKTLKWLPKVPV